ncbi:MAG: hypothetical protein R3B82_20855 [Sandaracinaceae bacterium]
MTEVKMDMDRIVEAGEWYEQRLGLLPYREALLLGAAMVSSPERPGPFYRRQLFTLLTVWGPSAHPMGWQKEIQAARDSGHFESSADGDYVTTAKTFAWIERFFPSAPRLHAPIPGHSFHWEVIGQLRSGVHYSVRYLRGKVDEVATWSEGGIAARSRGWSGAYAALKISGRWPAEFGDEEPRHVLESRIYGYDPRF